MNLFKKAYGLLLLRLINRLQEYKIVRKVSQDNVIGDVTFPICHNDNYEVQSNEIFCNCEISGHFQVSTANLNNEI